MLSGERNQAASARPEMATGRVFWITGLSGAGKSTVGLQLWHRLRKCANAAVFLDGDDLRTVIAEDLDHELPSRRKSARRNARLCGLLASQGIDVVCATISMFHEIRRWNRAHLSNYYEIYLRVPMEILRRRDSKGYYAAADQGTLSNVIGIDIIPELPESPDLVIDNYDGIDSAAAVETIWRTCITPKSGTPASCRVSFGTKAETLEALAPLLRSGIVLPQFRFTVGEWRSAREHTLSRLARNHWSSAPVIVRSSAMIEDGSQNSQAGRFESVLGVLGRESIAAAADRVIASFGENPGDSDQIFVQPMLDNVRMAGVAFSRHPDGGSPYFIINYDARTGQTDQVTSGLGAELATYYCLRLRRSSCAPELAPVVALLCELETLLGSDALDVEFAVDHHGGVHLLQVRRLLVHVDSRCEDAQIHESLEAAARKIELLSRPHPYLHGNRAIFGVMPDWNPAEIVGLRPYPLSLSLYRELVTDAIWAYQRDNYGYQNLRSFPLLISFQGLPYIDVRVSFNSFVPRDLPGDLANRLVNYYIDCLQSAPHLHDKVEFEIIFSCYTLDFPQRLNRLAANGFSTDDIAELSDALRQLTNRIIHGESALWRRDRAKVEKLAQRLPILNDSKLDKISRIYWLIEDCKRYGTLPFAGLARAGFIAVQLLKSFVSVGVLDAPDYSNFLASVETVGSRISHDFSHLPREEFLGRYGHLRPGTYDILSPRYDEAPELYFDWSCTRSTGSDRPRFALTIEQLRRIETLLHEHKLETDVLSLIEFIKASIEGREYAKFMFTRNLSNALSLIKALGQDHGLTVEDCAFLDYATIRTLYSESGNVSEMLHAGVQRGRARHAQTKNLILPPLISRSDDVYAFHLPPSAPNYVTRKSVTAAVAGINDPPETFAGKILFIPSADPGYDWIFTRGICGFITQFGGLNSHMAIRANEIGIPAVIGAGEILYHRWQKSRKLCIDCCNQRILQIA